MENENNLYVTIGVLSYNSAATILETLDSVASQTYKNIELVVSDDGSLDNTLSLVYDWLEVNSNLFVNTEVITVNNNTGTPANCNRLLKKAKGDWLKMIAADDILLPNCIENFVDFVLHSLDVKVIYSNYKSFVKNADGSIKIVESKIDDEVNKMFNAEPQAQLFTYIEQGFNISPAVFINLDFARSIGFIEKYRVFEDTPFYVRILKGGTKIYHLDKDTVLYRCDGDSVTRSSNKVHFYKQTFWDYNLMFRKDIIYQLYPWYKIKFWIEEYSFRVLYSFTIKVLNNKRTTINNTLYYCFKALNPYYLVKFISKIWK